MYEKVFQKILDASQNNALSFFVGAGVSTLSGAPTWKALIDSICNKIGIEKKETYSSDEALRIPQMFYYSLDEDKDYYYKFVEEQLHSIDLAPNPIHKEMFNLNPVSFITTNFDTLLENAAAQYCQSFKVVACDDDVPSIFGDRVILKIHGDFKNHNFVLKEEDYLNYSENYKMTETLLKSIFSTNTVVFIGYGLNDYNIKLILNWTKSLLKDSFRSPIFIYTDDQVLTREDLLYQESKGLTVVDWHNLLDDSEEFLARYQSFFDRLRYCSSFSIEGKTDEEAFDALNSRLEPLDKLDALRKSDVSRRLQPYVYIGDEGTIRIVNDGSALFKQFIDISKMSEDEREMLPNEILEKYRKITDVLGKARIFEINDNQNQVRLFKKEVPFADINCILFNYKAMYDYAEKAYDSIENNYKKAYYLAKLKRYDEAFFLFSQVATDAFNQKDYLKYYLSESNCVSLRKVIEHVHSRYHCYDLDAVKDILPNNTAIENLFRHLAVEFRNTYDNLKDIHSAGMLYKYSYEAFTDGQKLLNAVESEALEFGLTSSGKAICRINDYLHFLQGNGIVVDVFTEYKSTIKNLMSLLVYKYSTQGHIKLRAPLFPELEEEEIYFDEVDFYCFIESFTSKELHALLTKYHIETIVFHNIDKIQQAVCNLLDYYELAVKVSNNSIDVINLQNEIKTCLMLLRYIDISQELVDRVCTFLLKQGFREILISDIIGFIDSQVGKRKKYSDCTAKSIENALISYLDQQIKAIEKNKHFELHSDSASINYCNLVHYIYPEEKGYISRRLSRRISYIIDNDLSQLYPQIAHHYYSHVSNYQKKRLLTWAEEKLAQDFNFDLFAMLVFLDASIKVETLDELKAFLRKQVTVETDSAANQGFVVYPKPDPYEELVQVGYWCFLKRLKTEDFEEFLGKSAAFDFYCEYTGFDFQRFDVSWLLYLYPNTLEHIAADEKVKTNIRSVIAKVLLEQNVSDSDRKRLQEILIKYFC